MTNTDKERADFEAWWTRYRLGAPAFRSTDEDAYAAYRAGREAERAEASPSPGTTAIEALKVAIEGECDGLAIDDAQATVILNYVAQAERAENAEPVRDAAYIDGLEQQLAAFVMGGHPVTLQFPTMLRKMWSGGEVQAWLDKLPTMYTHPPEPSPDVEALRTALEEAEELLALVEMPSFPDPRHHDRVKSLGREIGFGALMSTASAGWREVSEAKGYPSGGEFVAGPCLGSVQRTLRIIRAALSKPEGK